MWSLLSSGRSHAKADIEVTEGCLMLQWRAQHATDLQALRVVLRSVFGSLKMSLKDLRWCGSERSERLSVPCKRFMTDQPDLLLSDTSTRDMTSC